MSLAERSPAQSDGKWTAAICAGLAILTWFVFGQTLRFGFVNYDDPEWVRENLDIISGLTIHGVRWAFLQFHSGPLSSVSHMLDCQLFGLRPWGHHLTNVLLHMATVVLLFLALRNMTGALWRSALVAGLFAVHPLRVESVAWITERKDVLSGLFFALTLLAYIAYARHPSVVRYLLVAVFFAGGLLSKAMLVTLPAVLLLLDFWPLERWHGRVAATSSGRLLWEKLPLGVMSLGCACATWWTHAQSAATIQAVPLLPRMSNAMVGFVIYVRQTFYPAGLAVFYGFVENRPPLLVGLALLFVAGVSWAAIKWRHRWPYWCTGWFWYVIMLLPVSGLWQIGQQAHADRYSYLPQIGLFVFLVWGVAGLATRWPRVRPLIAAMSLMSVALCAVTARQAAGYWRDSESLWNRALAVEPANEFAHASLADLLLREGRVQEAISHAMAALRVNPRNADAHNNLALGLSRTGHLSEAIGHWQEALAIHPDNLNARCNLAWVWAANAKASIEDGTRALELVGPVAAGSGGANSTVLQILAGAYARSGRFEEAASVARQGREVALRQKNQALADQLQVAIDRYDARQPWIDESLVDAPAQVPPLLTRPP
jgi:Flp pilus assembly protein TadD